MQAFFTDGTLGLRGQSESSLSVSFAIYVLLGFFGGFIRTEANVCFVTIMKVDYQPTRCFCNYQAYGCLVFCCVLSKFVFAIFSTLYVNIKRSQQTERNVSLVTVMKVEYKPTGCLSKLQACTYSVFCSVLFVESLYSYL